MPFIKLAELEHVNTGLRRSRTGSGDRMSGILARYRTSTNETYTDVLDRVVSMITEIQDVQ